MALKKRKFKIAIFVVIVVFVVVMVLIFHNSFFSKVKENISDKEDTSSEQLQNYDDEEEEVIEEEIEEELDELIEENSITENSDKTSTNSQNNSTSKNNNTTNSEKNTTVDAESAVSDTTDSTIETCTPKKFYTTFRADFTSQSECESVYNYYHSINPDKYLGFICSYQTDDCGNIYYMLTFFDSSGNYFGYNEI